MQKSFPVSVLMDYVPTPANRWQAGRWSVSGVVAANPDSGRRGLQAQRLHAGGDDSRTLWSGLAVELFRDDAESYYYNIVSDTPRIFVICSAEEGEALRPFIVTLSYDEAASYMESDESVESVAMPVELYRFVEQFVLENYVPEKKKKRKRDSWKESINERSPGH